MNIEVIGTCLFALALMHTFLVSKISRFSLKFAKDSKARRLLHLLSEVELVFGLWALLLLLLWAVFKTPAAPIEYLQTLSMTEPLFIFCIMVVAASRPVITFSRQAILWLSRTVSARLGTDLASTQLFMIMTLGPLLGSLITEPAAITISALLLYRMINDVRIDSRLLYGLLALLFVNVSVGGALTNFAAPPVLMVAKIWSWSIADVFLMLGEAAIASIVINTLVFILLFRKKFSSMLIPIEVDHYVIPHWLSVTQLLWLGFTVAAAHHSGILVLLFVGFYALTKFTGIYQDELKLKGSLMVAFFLAGLIVFGSFQRWWVEPLLLSMGMKTLFSGAVALTAVTDNAALTFLGTQVPGLNDVAKWALVAGALTGGGLTILANAPNPAGFSILSSKFPGETLDSVKLLKAAALPTLIAFICFYLKLFVF